MISKRMLEYGLSLYPFQTLQGKIIATIAEYTSEKLLGDTSTSVFVLKKAGGFILGELAGVPEALSDEMVSAGGDKLKKVYEEYYSKNNLKMPVIISFKGGNSLLPMVKPNDVNSVIIYNPNTYFAVLFVHSTCLEDKTVYMFKYQTDKNGMSSDYPQCSIEDISTGESYKCGAGK